MTKAPKIYAVCEVCDDEYCCHPLEDIRLMDGDTWTCRACFDECDDATPEEWKSLPSAAEWVTVREAPAEEQLCMHTHGVSSNNRCLNCGKDTE